MTSIKLPPETVKFKIVSRKHGPFITLIDKEDLPKVSEFRWQVRSKIENDRKYHYFSSAKRIKGKRHYASLHRVIMGVTGKEIVDHINGDTLDNRKSNLRICTPAQNAMNSRKRLKNSHSPFKGVVAVSQAKKKWAANICFNGKRIRLGCFENEVDAALAYDVKAIEFFKDFAVVNFPFHWEAVSARDHLISAQAAEIAELKSANDNCISLLLHESRMANAEMKIADLTNEVKQLRNVTELYKNVYKPHPDGNIP